MAQTLASELPQFAASQWVEQIGSTNAALLALAREQGSQAGWPRLLGAHHQTQGKGRLGRAWHDIPGKTLMFSCGFSLPIQGRSLSALQGLGPALGSRSVLALQPLITQPQRMRVKWPNDIMIDDGKSAGVLIELANATDCTFIIIGMGLNLYGHETLQVELRREIGEIGPLLLPGISASQLASTLANAWHETLNTLYQHGFETFRAAYSSVDYLANRDVNIIDQGQVVASGMASGLGPDGSLQLSTLHGMQHFHVGDVSARLNTPVSHS
jgi:BirA family biotin operon repressor/biotin-[acetyl-CoA-carboxylase] ligase